MATTGGGRSGGSGPRPPRPQDQINPNVEELLQKLNLTTEEGQFAEFSDDDDGGMAEVKWALMGKVVPQVALHANTIKGAMKPAWGNPFGMKLRSIGEKGDNLFVAEFGCKEDMERILAGSPWMVGRYAVILKEYDGKLKPSEIRFDRMEIWVPLLNLPLGWMNVHRGIRAMRLLGQVVKMDVDGDGNACGAFLRARMAIDISRPIRRSVLLKLSKDGMPEWFDVQYERLPYFCRSCGIIGHTEVECDNPTRRDASVNLPYDLKLRAPDDRKKKMQSFTEAASESFGSGSSFGSRPSRDSTNMSDGRHSAKVGVELGHETEEVTSPLKQQTPSATK